jgi:small subunit ribosomal protein S8
MSLLSTDPIADMLTRIRNAIMVGKNQVVLPGSKIKFNIAKQLVKSGYLSSVEEIEDKPQNQLKIVINQDGQSPKIAHIERVSKPGRRYYVQASEIPTIKNGRGMVLVSTSKGIMDGVSAKLNKVGGEVICKIY